jgi:hypothetical protein
VIQKEALLVGKDMSRILVQGAFYKKKKKIKNTADICSDVYSLFFYKSDKGFGGEVKPGNLPVPLIRPCLSKQLCCM